MCRCLIWLYLLLLRRGFWLLRERDTAAGRRAARHWPSVVAVVPARNEAEVIQQSIGSLLAQDYPGDFRIVLVDDQSAMTAPPIWRAALTSDRLTVLTGGAAPARLDRQALGDAPGRDHARPIAPEFIWFTDADIAHSPDNLAPTGGAGRRRQQGAGLADGAAVIAEPPPSIS